MTSRYSPNRAGIGAMLCSPEMEAALLVHATKVLTRAEEIAPVDETGPHPGRYKAAFFVSSGVRRIQSRRAYARVTNDAPEALFVEFGTVHNPRHRTLGRALDALRG